MRVFRKVVYARARQSPRLTHQAHFQEKAEAGPRFVGEEGSVGDAQGSSPSCETSDKEDEEEASEGEGHKPSSPKPAPKRRSR